MKIIGIDPGLGICGMAAVGFDPSTSERKLLWVKAVRTKAPTSKKTNVKEASLLCRRLFDLYGKIREGVDGGADAFAIEEYQHIPGRGKNSRKTIAGVDVAMSVVFGLGKVPMLFTPPDIRRSILGKGVGAKEEVWAALKKSYGDIVLPEGTRDDEVEHMMDAVAIAESAAREMEERIRMTGGT